MRLWAAQKKRRVRVGTSGEEWGGGLRKQPEKSGGGAVAGTQSLNENRALGRWPHPQLLMCRIALPPRPLWGLCSLLPPWGPLKMTHWKIQWSRYPVADGHSKTKYKSCPGSRRRGANIYWVWPQGSDFLSGAPVSHPFIDRTELDDLDFCMLYFNP